MIQQSQEQQRTQQKSSEKYVLIAAQDEGLRALLKIAIVLETPYSAYTVSSGKDALYVATTMHFDLFLLDFHLRDISGLKLYENLHTTPGLEDIPAVIFTTSSNTDELNINLPMLIEEPFELDELFEKLSHFLAS